MQYLFTLVAHPSARPPLVVICSALQPEHQPMDPAI